MLLLGFVQGGLFKLGCCKHWRSFYVGLHQRRALIALLADPFISQVSGKYKITKENNVVEVGEQESGAA
jgi:hypothetical protein